MSSTKLKVNSIIKILKLEYGQPKSALNYENPFQLVIATILSAQCTDARVNIVTADLFKKYPTIESLAFAKLEEIEQAVRSTGFFRMKAKNIQNCAIAILNNHNGIIPKDMSELVKLPGIGRKTANVITGNIFGIYEGVVVDTHVQRLSTRIGLSKHNTPEKIELDLMKATKKADWFLLSNLLIVHGRKVCQARKPNCKVCKISNLCEFKKNIKEVKNEKY